MLGNDKILILTGKYGDGHMQAARAICQTLQENHPGVVPVLMDIMKLTHPYTHPIGRFIFIQGVKKFPSAYGYLYSKTKPDNSLSNLLKQCGRFGLGKLLGAVKQIRPSVVVSTFPPAAGAMSLLRASRYIDIPNITMITDHTHHSYWVHPHTDHYLVGSDVVKQGLLSYPISEGQISVTGIPIKSEFSRDYDRQSLMDKFKLNPYMPTLLFMGGGEGLIGEGSSLLDELEKIPMSVQIILVCGRNDKLRQQLMERAWNSKHVINVTGYIDYVHELMAISDLVVTKPGGITVSEALAMELPLLLFKPLPGQEVDNARFLIRSGAALSAHSQEELIRIITETLVAPEKLLQMKERTKLIQKKSAAEEAANRIYSLHLDAVSRRNHRGSLVSI